MKTQVIREVKVTPRQKAEKDMADYASKSVRKEEIQAAIKEAVAAINAQFADELAQLNPELEKLETELNIFAESHLEEFAGKKSLKLETGTIGWRLDMGKLVYQQDADLDGLKKLLQKELPDALDVKVDAKKVISACKIIGSLPVKLQGLGITVEQKDKFFVTANK
jgi:phage host-nuclease inhibitor protein Gam